MDRKKLYERIDSRVDKMFLNGALEENTKLYEKNIHIKGIGYQEFDDYFKGLITLDEVKEQIKLNSHHLAKRQLTWFRRDKRIVWYSKEEIVSKILDDLNK